MRRDRRAKQFARTLLNTVGFEAAPKAIEELTALNTLMAKSRGFYTLLSGPQFSDAEKQAVINEAGSSLKLGEETVKFVGHLTGLGAVSSLPEVIESAVMLYRERNKTVKVTVYCPSAMEGGYEERLKASLKRLTGRDVDAEYVVDPTLIGGLLIKVGSTMYDGSIKGQLRLLRNELIKG